jgi:hypothetical protein
MARSQLSMWITQWNCSKGSRWKCRTERSVIKSLKGKARDIYGIILVSKSWGELYQHCLTITRDNEESRMQMMMNLRMRYNAESSPVKEDIDFLDLIKIADHVMI